VVRRSSACARTGRARYGPADRAARPGRGTTRATGGVWRGGKIKAPRGTVSWENARGLGRRAALGCAVVRTPRRPVYGRARRRGAADALADTILD
jgi:hypothetical protein